MDIVHALRSDEYLQRIFEALLGQAPPVFKWRGTRISIWTMPMSMWYEHGKGRYEMLIEMGILREYTCTSPVENTAMLCITWDPVRVREIAASALGEEWVERAASGGAARAGALRAVIVDAMPANRWMSRLENHVREVNRYIRESGLSVNPLEFPFSVSVKLWCHGEKCRETRRETARDPVLYDAVQEVLRHVERDIGGSSANVFMRIDPRRVEISIVRKRRRLDYSFSRNELSMKRKELVKAGSMPVERLAYISLLASRRVIKLIKMNVVKAAREHAKTLEVYASIARGGGRGDAGAKLLEYAERLRGFAGEVEREYRKLVKEPPREKTYSELYRSLVESINKPQGVGVCYDSILLVALANGLPIVTAVKAYKKFLETGETRVEVEARTKRRVVSIPEEVVGCVELLGADDRNIAHSARLRARVVYGVRADELRHAYIKHLFDSGHSVSDIVNVTGLREMYVRRVLNEMTRPIGEAHVALRELVLRHLAGQSKPAKTREIAAAIGVNERKVTRVLTKLRKRGVVEKIKDGWVLL